MVPKAALDFIQQLKSLNHIIYLTYSLGEYQERNSIPRVTVAPLQPCGSAARESFLGKQQREAATTMSRRAAFSAAAGATNATQATAVVRRYRYSLHSNTAHHQWPANAALCNLTHKSSSSKLSWRSPREQVR